MFRNLKISPALENLVVIFVLLLANRRALVFQDFYLRTPFEGGHLWVELSIWSIIFLWALWKITRDKLWGSFANAWKRNWFLIPFLSVVGLSLFWTIHFQASLYRVLVLFLSTFIAAYIGFYSDRNRLLDLLSWAGGILILTSYLTIFTLPIAGTMMGHPYYDAWRGVFWHRNHLSITMAFTSILFFLQMIQHWKDGGVRFVLPSISWLLTIPLVAFSRSLTGIGLFVGLHILAGFLAVYWKYRKIFNITHLRVLAIILVLILAIGLSQFERVTSIVNKSASWSGRLVLWKWLLSNMVQKRPFLGYGYGAIWNFHNFRVSLGDAVGWSMPVLFGDNGYLDISLHLGLVGISLFLLILVIAIIRFFKYGIYGGAYTSFIPLLLILFLLISNISFSLFMEVEIFFWILLVVFLFNRINSKDLHLSK